MMVQREDFESLDLHSISQYHYSKIEIENNLERIFLLERGMIFFKLLWSMKYTCNI